ncbi:hypothetical protein C3747_110g38 [Trypanosoma cruzi]|uniref:Uncharacterized protein n=2 Tax=Trypanosoma cruzi TaxID=5693 RepID=Q4DZT9_TRYCC|nr:hypothetical protein Tc00.1047053510105.160 [Trypanosoma cruzi]EAN98041.1 hypothetical protein Tc00.1047053510105.160 [Trypanosoma cruzi]PWV06784.1 hypothetical protein C3747_110g38 [Trypanosoma cruzi]|eukprot:XP_819892.1 hypothetical protein [Trypanosoma cruzi strain CL Brener]
MVSKGKQLSVLIAGANGSIGRELVSLLVSHPDVGRVVALSQTPIPINRWRSSFPRIHPGDALRCLSVVSVDWDKIAADASHVPASYVRAGVWSNESEANPGLLDAWRRIRGSAAATGLRFSRPRNNGVKGNGGSRKAARGSNTGGPCGGRGGEKNGTNRGVNGDEALGRGGRNASRFPTTSGSRSKAGYVKMSMGDPTASAEARNKFLNELLETNFYKSVFSGHHVVINCLSSRNRFMRSEVNAVDHQYAIAFAKIVRIFNCMVHAEPSEEEEMLMDKHATKQNSVLWGEIYAACYGHADCRWFYTGEELEEKRDGEEEDVLPTCPEQRLSRGGVGTLRQFTQVSVMGGSLWNSLPYFRAHGEFDKELLALFNRNEDDIQDNFMQRRGPRGDEDDVDDDRDYALGEEASVMARRRAEMLLRRDVVKLWDNSHLTIWRPGLLQRDNLQLVEKILGVFTSRVDVKQLAEAILEDIIASLEDERGFNEVGTAKVIGGNNVVARAKMKEAVMEWSWHGKRIVTTSSDS